MPGQLLWIAPWISRTDNLRGEASGIRAQESPGSQYRKLAVNGGQGLHPERGADGGIEAGQGASGSLLGAVLCVELSADMGDPFSADGGGGFSSVNGMEPFIGRALKDRGGRMMT